MLRSWCRVLVAAACVLAAGSGASAATSVSIEPAAPGSATVPRPAVVVVRDLSVPAAGATVTVFASAQGLTAPAKLATVVILGGRTTAGVRERSFRSIVDAPPSVVETIARDARATITLNVQPMGHPEAATSAGPFPVSFTRRPGPT